MALESQARIDEGTYDSNYVYSRVPYPIGLKAITVQEAESLNPVQIQQSLFGKLIQSFESLVGQKPKVEAVAPMVDGARKGE